jgi:hypothetical protein
MHARRAARPNTHGSMIWGNPVTTDDPDKDHLKFKFDETALWMTHR